MKMDSIRYKGAGPGEYFGEHRGWNLRWGIDRTEDGRRYVVVMEARTLPHCREQPCVDPAACAGRPTVPIRRSVYPETQIHPQELYEFFIGLETEIRAAVDAVEVEESAWTSPAK